MNKTLSTALFLTSVFITQLSYAQSNQELALEKGKAAVRLEDEEGKYDDAVKLFDEAQKLDPENINYPYEMAYAYTGAKEYKRASDILEKLLFHKDVNARVYQALGNAYDYQGQSDKAVQTYEKGLKKFPNSGELYLELGNLQIVKKDYSKALDYYEEGLKADPAFPSNYYWAAKIYCSSDEEVWGMIYGEIFMNLERNSKRTGEISKMLFDTYKSEIKFTSDTSYSVSFSKNATIDVNDVKNKKKIKLPFGTGVYEMNLMFAILGEKTIDINSLDRIRTRFLEDYFKGNSGKDYPNILFEYQKKVKAAGHLEAYNHWILMKGDETGFENWEKTNELKWNSFIKWFSENKLEVDLSHRFYRGQY